MLSDNSAMDPSQMFIMLTDQQQHTFPYSPPQTSIGINDPSLEDPSDVHTGLSPNA